jgi:YidC/Oxa1 family membrane protein insertase
MDFFNQIIGYPLGWIMWAMYAVVPNYAVALLLFTLLTKVATLPISLKQQKSSARMMIIQPKQKEIQERYKGDKEKMNAELMKLYEKEKYNPMSGCLPMLIQFPILFGVIDVVYKPLFHILRLPQELIQQAMDILSQVTGTQARAGLSMAQLEIIRGIKADPTPYMALGQDVINQIQSLNLTFLGMDLTMTPTFAMFGEIFSNFNPVILIPILSGVSALASSLISMRNTGSDSQTNSTMKGMMYIMPLMSAWIAFSVPAGVGLYWFYSNITQIFQTMIMNKIYNPKEEIEKAKKEAEERAEQERLERIEAKKQAREARSRGEKSDIKEEALTAKEAARRKLAEARRRDAEKYGEEYVEVTDEDLR